MMVRGKFSNVSYLAVVIVAGDTDGESLIDGGSDILLNTAQRKSMVNNFGVVLPKKPQTYGPQ